MKELNLNVEGLMCGGCEKRVETAIGNMKEVKKVKANHKDGTIKIVLKGEIEESKIKEVIDDLGFKVI